MYSIRNASVNALRLPSRHCEAVGLWNQVTIREPLLAQHDFTDAIVYRLLEAWSVRHERVELTAFSARINFIRQVAEKVGVVWPTCEISTQHLRVDANDARLAANRKVASRRWSSRGGESVTA